MVGNLVLSLPVTGADAARNWSGRSGFSSADLRVSGCLM